MKVIKFEDFNLLQIGNEYEISGVLYEKPTGNFDKPVDNLLIVLPEGQISTNLEILFPSLDQWNEIIRQSDLKEVELVGGDKNKKIILRKSTRQIDQKTMWEVFRRDRFMCRYCGADDVPMTVDHIVLWEEGGPSIPKNLLCSCKKCNNTRNNMQYEDWIKSDYYIRAIKKLPYSFYLDNHLVLNDIPEIREKHMRVHKRNR